MYSSVLVSLTDAAACYKKIRLEGTKKHYLHTCWPRQTVFARLLETLLMVPKQNAAGLLSDSVQGQNARPGHNPAEHNSMF